MTENGGRRHLPPERKFEIVKEVIMGKAAVSEVCKKHGISTALYYKWQQVFFHGALEGLTHHKRNAQGSRRGERLLAENQRLKEIIAEIASENLQLKKVLGNRWACRG